MSVTIRIDMQLPVVLEMHIDLVQGPLCMCIPSIILYGGGESLLLWKCMQLRFMRDLS